MGRTKGTGLGSIYYRSDRNVWIVQQVYYDSITNKNRKKSSDIT